MGTARVHAASLSESASRAESQGRWLDVHRICSRTLWHPRPESTGAGRVPAAGMRPHSMRRAQRARACSPQMVSGAIVAFGRDSGGS
jgi:hypothetical protein